MIERPQPRDFLVIAGLPMFVDLRSGEIDALLADATVRTYGEDSLLFSAGDPAERFFAIIEGFVRLFALSEDGHETIIEVIGPGNSFAEGAIFATARYPVNAEAMAGARVVSLQAATLIRLLGQDSHLGLRMLASMNRWQLRLMAELQQLKRRSPAQRLAWYLLSLIDPSSESATASLPYRKGIIAGRIGITPESLSRALARLNQQGVEIHGDTVRIGSVEKLKQYCHAPS
ncbi:MAG: cyclic nucleotide-binding domain-containing protein [Rhodospirillales bacterium]|jgi:CRP-like cAMP-binding protein|nr:cyclic nucleotide-binding domain-containing protein [Rhodospirillales bacterium]